MVLINLQYLNIKNINENEVTKIDSDGLIIEYLINSINLLLDFNLFYFSSCNGDIYPVFHGYYVSTWYDDGGIQEYEYWHLDNIDLVDFFIYSNYDLLFIYYSQIINNPFKNTDLLPKIDSLIRIESKTGKTIWAKELIYHSGN